MGAARCLGGASPGTTRLAFVAAAALILLATPARAVSLSGAWPWPWHPNDTEHGGEQLNQKWAQTLAELWSRSKASVAFCLGGSQDKAQRLMGLSFPWPLPVSAFSSDVICSNRSRIDQYLCSPLELEIYYKFMLLTEDLQKVPDNAHCTAGGNGSQPACAPGFYDAQLDNRAASSVPQEPAACCEGYFCPSQLTCMVPCPLGAYCPRSWPALPPDAYKSDAPGRATRWCAPYAYKERQDLGCGGADKWRIIPGSAFPNAFWPEGSGSIFCDGGRYCPNTTSRLDCTAGHFCRQGETEPERCPPGAFCPPHTEIPASNYTGVTVDALLFGCLWLAYVISKQYNRVLLQLSQKERLKIVWGASPEIRIVQAAPRTRTPTPTHPRPHSVSLKHELPNTPGRGPVGFFNRRQNRGRRSASKTGGMGQVWAAFSGPEAGPLSADGHEPLLDEHDGSASSGADALELSQAGVGDFSADCASPVAQAGSAASPTMSPAVSLHALGPGTAHARMDSLDNEDGMTPMHLHAHMLAQHRQSLLSSPLSSVHAGTAMRRQALCVEFQELGLRLKAYGGKMVLQGVTGMLPAGQVTAIMGPSGAGKTTLLNVLANKAQSYGTVTGSISINGRPDRLERYKRVMGFVPQDDIMHASLTVYENLLFSARFRLPAHFGREQHIFFVERTISVLRLDDVRDCKIGNEESRGISGGQRKRVNVGLELVADPVLLLLDEPTSGLDSSASKALVAALQAVSRSGVTCAAVIHQPSWQTCQMFNHLLLLGKGGRTVYCGPMSGAQAYFEGLGFQFPAHQNPADAMMDITSGELMRPGQLATSELFELWEERCGRPGKPAALGTGTDSQRILQDQAMAVHGRGSTDDWREAEQGGAAVDDEGAISELLGDEEERRSWKRRFREAILFASAEVAAGAANSWRAIQRFLAAHPGAHRLGMKLFRRHNRHADDLLPPQRANGSEVPYAVSTRAVPKRHPPGFLAQYRWCLERAVLQRSREPLSIFTDYLIFALTGLTLGLISDRGRETILHFAVGITYSVVALGLLSTVGALSTFGKDRVVFYREAASGLNRLAYFFALETFDHTGTVMRSAVYFVVYYSFAAPRAVIWQMLLISIAIAYCCTGVAYLLSQVMEPSAAQLSAAVLALVNTLIARQGKPHGLIKLAQMFSFARWGLEGYVIAESNKLTGVWLLARCADLMGLQYDVRHYALCLLALFGLGLMFRMMALLALFSLNRDKQR